MVKKKDYIEPVLPTYCETQRFRQLWVWTFVTVPIVVTMIGLGWSIFNTPSNITIILITLISSIFFSSIIYLIYIASLDTKTTADGVYIKFRPFHRKWIQFPFESIQGSESCKYNPIRDYGGYGIRYGSKGKAYNVSGNKGVLIKFSEGKPLLIGSQKHLELSSVINNHLPKVN
tara:strand:+ start:920 stop:1441 length:522 start_codon:yes stop_codon:yes gene_type:complete